MSEVDNTKFRYVRYDVHFTLDVIQVHDGDPSDSELTIEQAICSLINVHLESGSSRWALMDSLKPGESLWNHTGHFKVRFLHALDMNGRDISNPHGDEP